ncbi:hypothetical protein CPB85DRAFT_1339015 [Mucidula mucida]|nr:hypothetical protein CPB85DRAFT_1339015 [Mucidula mucida]
MPLAFSTIFARIVLFNASSNQPPLSFGKVASTATRISWSEAQILMDGYSLISVKTGRNVMRTRNKEWRCWRTRRRSKPNGHSSRASTTT